jgi:hypothetical protein
MMKIVHFHTFIYQTTINTFAAEVLDSLFLYRYSSVMRKVRTARLAIRIPDNNPLSMPALTWLARPIKTTVSVFDLFANLTPFVHLSSD